MGTETWNHSKMGRANPEQKCPPVDLTSKEPGFNCQPSHGNSQLYVTLVPGVQTPSLDLHGYQTYTCTYKQITHIHKIILKIYFVMRYFGWGGVVDTVLGFSGGQN